MTNAEKRSKLEKEICELRESRDALVITQSAPYAWLGKLLLFAAGFALLFIFSMVYINFWASYVLEEWFLYLAPALVIGTFLVIKKPLSSTIERNRKKRAVIQKEIDAMEEELKKLDK